MPLKVDIVTAERLVYSEEGVDRLIVPGVEGELGVLTLHAPLLTMIQPGVLRSAKEGDEVEMAITGGFIEVRENRVTILADAAERAEEIDVVRAEEARRRAQRLLGERGAGGGPARGGAGPARDPPPAGGGGPQGAEPPRARGGGGEPTSEHGLRINAARLTGTSP